MKNTTVAISLVDVFFTAAFRAPLTAALVSSLAFLGGNAHATTNVVNKVNTSATSDLSLGSNYSTGLVPNTTNDMEFQAGTYTNGYTFDLNNGALTPGTLDDLNSTAIIITNVSGKTGTITLSTANNGVSGSAAADLLYVATGANLTISQGTGALTLLTGVTGNFDNKGTLSISAPLSIGAGTTLSFTGGGATTVGGAIASTTGALTVNSSGGNVTLSGANLYSGTTTLSAGTLTLSGSGTLGTNTAALAITGGTLNLGGTSQIVGAVTDNAASSINNGTLTGSSYSFTNTSGTINVGAALAGTGIGVAYSSSGGTLSLGGVNTYTGATSVSAGSLVIANGGSTSTNSAFTVNTGGSAVVSSGGTINGAVTDNISGGTTTGNFTNSGTVVGNLTIAAGTGVNGGAIIPSGNTIISGNATLNGGSSTSSGGTITDNGQLTILGSSPVTLGTLASTGTNTAGTGAIFYGNTYSSGNTLNFASGASIAYFDPNISNAVGTLNTAGTAYIGIYGENNASASVAQPFNITFDSGTWNIGQVGQNSSGKQTGGTTNILGGATINLSNALGFLYGNNGGNYMHGIWDIGGASAGTLAITGNVSESNGSTGTPVSGAINGLQFTVGNGGTLSTLGSGVGTVSLGLNYSVQQTSVSDTNSITVNSGGTATINYGINLGQNAMTTNASGLSETNSVTVNTGGTLTSAGNGANYALELGGTAAGANNQTNSFTVTGGSATLNNSVTLGLTGNIGSGGITDSLNLSGGKLLINGLLNASTPTNTPASITTTQSAGASTVIASTLTGLAIGQVLTGTDFPNSPTITNITSVSNNVTLTLSSGTGVVAGTGVSATATGTGAATNGFFWTGGQLTAATITASTNFNASGSSISGTNFTNNGSSGSSLTTLAPGDIGTGGKTTVNGSYIQGTNGVLALDLGSTTAASAFQSGTNTYDVLAVTGGVTLGGTLNVSLINSFTPTAANSFSVLTSGSLPTGNFSNVNASSGRVNLAGGTGSLLLTLGSTTSTLSAYSSGSDLVWNGNVSSTWDTTSNNFNKNVAGTVTAGTYSDGSFVTFDNTATPGTVTLNLTVNPGGVYFGNSTGTYNISGSGAIGGTGGLTQVGTANNILSTANTFTGATTLSAGTLTLNNQNALQNSIVSIGAGTGTTGTNNGLQFQSGIGSFTVGGLSGSSNEALLDTAGSAVALTVGNNNSTGMNYAGVLSGSGSLTKTGTGAQTLSGANTFSGATTISAGTLILGNQNALQDSSVTISTGTGTTGTNNGLQFQPGLGDAFTVGGLSGASNEALLDTAGNAVALTVGNNNGTSTYSGVLSGAGSLAKTGTGTQTLSGANTYTGTTSIGNGTLSIASLNNVSSGHTASSNLGAPTTVANGTIALGSTTNTGTLLYTGGGQTTDRVINLAGTTGGGNLDTTGAAGGLIFSSNFTATGVGAKTLTIQGNTTGNAINGTIVDSSSGSTSLTKAGTGTWTLGAANTFSGATTLSAGTLVLNNESALQDSVVTISAGTGSTGTNNGLQFQSGLGDAFVVGGLSGATNEALLDTAGNAVALTVGNNNGTSTYSGVLSGSGSLVKTGTGTQTLSGANTYTGATTLSAGTLVLNNENALQDSTVALNTGNGTTGTNNALQFQSGLGDAFTIGGLSGASNEALLDTAGTAVALTVGNNNATSTYSGVLSGAGSLAKTGTGTESLSGANTYTGATSVSAGSLVIASGGSTASASAFTVNTGGSAVVNSGGTINGTVTDNISTGASTGNFTNTGIVVGNVTISAGSGPINPQANTVVSGNVILNGGSSTSNGGTITDNGQLTILGSTGVTLGTIASTNGTINGTGAIYYGNTNATGNTLNFAPGTSIAWFDPNTSSGATAPAGINGTLNTTATSSNPVYINVYGENGANPVVGQPFNITFGSGTWDIGQVGQNNSGKVTGGTTNILGGATINLSNALGFSIGNNGGTFMHGFWNVGGASAGTLAIVGNVNESGGSGVAPATGATNGLQFTVGNGGTLSTTGGSATFGLAYAASQTSSLVNGITLNSGGTVSLATGLVLGQNQMPLGAVTETNSVTVNGGTFTGSANGLGIGNNSAGANNQINTFSVAGGTATAVGNSALGTTANVGSGGVTDSINLSGGKLFLNGTLTASTPTNTPASITTTQTAGSTTVIASTLSGLAIGQTLTGTSFPNSPTITAITNVGNNVTLTLSSGTGVVAGTGVSATATGTGTVTNGFYWTGGQLTASSITPSAAFNGTGSSINSTTLTNNGSSGSLTTLAPGDIGNGGKTTINGNYIQGTYGVLALDIGGTTAASAFQSGTNTYDVLAVTGSVALGGKLNVSLIGGYTPLSTTTFTILTSGSAPTGNFTNVDPTSGRVSLTGGGSLLLTLGTTSSTLSQYGAGSDLVWNGNVSSTWDTASNNFNVYGSVTPTNYSDGSFVSFDNSTGYTPGTITLNSNLLPGGVAFGSNSGNYTISGTGSIGGSAYVIQDGTSNPTLSTVNTYTGATTITAGTLTIGGAGQLGSGSYAGAIAISSGALFNYNSSATQVLSGAISGSGSLTQSSGILTLEGTNSYTGTTTISGGTFAPGTIGFSGRTTLAGNLVQSGTGTLALDIGGTTASTAAQDGSNSGKYDQLIINGTGVSTLGNAPVINFINNSSGSNFATHITNGNSFAIISDTAGTFSNTNFANDAVATNSNSNTNYRIAAPNASNVYDGVASFGYILSSGTGVQLLDYRTTNFWQGPSGSGWHDVSGGTDAADWQYYDPNNTTFVAQFANTGVGSVIIDAATTVRGLNFSNTTGNYTLSGSSTLTLGDANNLATLTAGTSSGTTTISAPLIAANNLTISNAASTTQALDLTSFAGTITETGGGTVNLTGNAVGTGGITISSGSLAVTGSGQLNSGSYAGNISDAGAFTYAGSSPQTLSGIISGAGTLTENGTGALTLSGANTYTGGTTLSAGTIVLSSADHTGTNGPLGASGTITLGGGYLQFTSTNTHDYSSRFSTAANQNYNIDTNGQAVSLATNLTSSGGEVTKTGSGNLTLSGTNSYTGATTITAGTITAGSIQAIGSNSAVSLANTSGATLNLGGFNNSIGSLSGGGTAGGNVTLGGNTLTTGGLNSSTTYSGAISGTGGLIKTGTGTQTLTGSNTYSGGTTISGGGTLAVGATNTLATTGSVTLGQSSTSGTLQLGTGSSAYNQTVSSLTTSGSGSSNSVVGGNSSTASVLTINNSAPDTFAGTLGGSTATQNNLALTKSGTGNLNLTGANTYTGATTIGGGTLTLSGGSLGGTSVTANSGATLNVNGNYTIGTAGSGSVSVANGGTLSLVDGSINTLTINNTTSAATVLTFAIGSTLNMEVSGSTADEIALGSGLKASASGVTVNIVGLGTLTGGTQTLISAPGGGLGTTDFTLGSTTGTLGTAYHIVLNETSNDLYLVQVGSAPSAAYWTGSQDGNWNTVTGGTTTNFATDVTGATNTGSIPGNITNVFFAANGATNLSTTLGQDFTVNSVTFGSGTVGSSAVSIGGSNTLTILAGNAGGNTLGNGINVQTGSGNDTITANVALGSSQTWTNNSTNTLTVNGNIGDGGNNYSLTKAGSGSLVLGGANTYSGGTTLSAGTLVLGSSTTVTSGAIVHGPVGTGLLTLVGGTTVSDGGSAITLANNVSVSGSLTFLGGGSLTLDGTSLTTPATVNLTGNTTFNTVDPVTINDQVTGGYSLNQTGSGTLSLTNSSNSFSGGTTVGSGATVSFNNVGALGSSASTDTLTNGTLKYTGTNATLAQNITVTSGHQGTVNNSANNGVLTLSGTLTKTDSTLIFSGGRFNVTGQITGGTNTSFDSDLVVNNGSNVTLDNSNNNYTGPTDVYGASTLNNGINNALPTGTVLNLGTTGETSGTTNTYNLGGYNQTVAALNTIANGTNLVTNTGTSTLTLSGVDSDSNPQTSNFAGSIQNGTGQTSVTVSGGTHAFSGTNTYTGATTINGGTLNVSGSTSASAATINSGGTLQGIGTVGAVEVKNGGTLAPGDATSVPGSTQSLDVNCTLTLNGNLTVDAGATLSYNLYHLTSDTGTHGAIAGGTLLALNLTSGVFDVTGIVNINLNNTASGGDIGRPNAYTLVEFASTNLPLGNVTADFNVENLGGGLNPGNSATLQVVSLSGGGQALQLDVVPEPSTYALCLLGLGFLGLAVRRRTLPGKTS